MNFVQLKGWCYLFVATLILIKSSLNFPAVLLRRLLIILSIVITFPKDGQVEAVVDDLNAQYIYFVKHIFPNAQAIIDRFHIVQLTARFLDKCWTTLLISILENINSLNYIGIYTTNMKKKSLTTSWYSLTKSMNTCPQRNASDLISDFSLKFKQV